MAFESVGETPFRPGETPFRRGETPFSQGAMPFRLLALPYRIGGRPYKSGATVNKRKATVNRRGECHRRSRTTDNIVRIARDTSGVAHLMAASRLYNPGAAPE